MAVPGTSAAISILRIFHDMYGASWQRTGGDTGYGDLAIFRTFWRLCPRPIRILLLARIAPIINI